MTVWYLAWKRCMRPGFLCILIFLLAACFAAGLTGKQATLRPTGFTDEDHSVQSAEVCDALLQKGYRYYPSRTALTAAVSAGELDCGAVLLPGLGAQLARNQLSQGVLILHGPMSFLTELYEAQISAVLFRMTAPLRTAQSAKAAGATVSEEEIAARLRAYEEEGRPFTFTEEVSDGKPMPENSYGPRLSHAVAALLLFTALAVELRRMTAQARRLAVCIGYDRAARTVLLPQLLLSVFLSFLAAALPLAWLDHSILPGLFAFCLCIAALALLLTALPQRVLCVLLPCILLGSLALYPIYLDLCARLPSLAVVRLLLPPCWLVLTPSHPLLWGLGGLAALFTAYTLFRKRTLP